MNLQASTLLENFTKTPSENLAVLVVDPKNERAGKLGKVLRYDCKTHRVVVVGFLDGAGIFPDGSCESDPPSPIKVFYRLRNEKGEGFDKQGLGPLSLLTNYYKLGSSGFIDFSKEYEEVFRNPF